MTDTTPATQVEPPATKGFICRICKQRLIFGSTTQTAAAERAALPIGPDDTRQRDVQALRRGQLYTEDDFFCRVREWYCAEIERLIHERCSSPVRHDEQSGRAVCCMLCTNSRWMGDLPEPVPERKVVSRDETEIPAAAVIGASFRVPDTTPGKKPTPPPQTKSRGKPKVQSPPRRRQPPRAAKTKTLERLAAAKKPSGITKRSSKSKASASLSPSAFRPPYTSPPPTVSPPASNFSSLSANSSAAPPAPATTTPFTIINPISPIYSTQPVPLAPTAPVSDPNTSPEVEWLQFLEEEMRFTQTARFLCNHSDDLSLSELMGLVKQQKEFKERRAALWHKLKQRIPAALTVPENNSNTVPVLPPFESITEHQAWRNSVQKYMDQMADRTQHNPIQPVPLVRHNPIQPGSMAPTSSAAPTVPENDSDTNPIPPQYEYMSDLKALRKRLQEFNEQSAARWHKLNQVIPAASTIPKKDFNTVIVSPQFKSLAKQEAFKKQLQELTDLVDKRTYQIPPASVQRLPATPDTSTSPTVPDSDFYTLPDEEWKLYIQDEIRKEKLSPQPMHFIDTRIDDMSGLKSFVSRLREYVDRKADEVRAGREDKDPMQCKLTWWKRQEPEYEAKTEVSRKHNARYVADQKWKEVRGKYGAPDAEMNTSPSLGAWTKPVYHKDMEDLYEGRLDVMGLSFVVDVCNVYTKRTARRQGGRRFLML